MNTKPYITFLALASLLFVPAIGHGWQSGRLKNQRSLPKPSDTTSHDSDSTPPASNAPSESDEVRPTPPMSGGNSKIAWEHSMRSALKAASDGNKIVVVDVYADWCGWCKKMDRTVYSDPKVASLSNEVVFLKLNTDDRGEGRQFARQNRVTGLPTTVILNHKGSVIDIVKGYIGSSDQFIRMIERSKGRG